MEKFECEFFEDFVEGMKVIWKVIVGNMEIFFDLIDLFNYCKVFLVNLSKKFCNFGYVGGFY